MKFLVVALLFAAVCAVPIPQDVSSADNATNAADGLTAGDESSPTDEISGAIGDVPGADGSSPTDGVSGLTGEDGSSPTDALSGQTGSLTGGAGSGDSSEPESE